MRTYSTCISIDSSIKDRQLALAFEYFIRNGLLADNIMQIEGMLFNFGNHLDEQASIACETEIF